MANNIDITVLNKSKRRVEIDFDFNWNIVNDVKKITGRKYYKSKKVWRVNLNSGNLPEFLTFCQNHDIDIKSNGLASLVKGIKKKAEKKQSKYEENYELATKKEPNLEKIYGLSRGLNLRPFQRVAVEYIEKNKKVLIGDQMGLGKAQPLNSKILTPSGWTTMGEISIGDDVIGSDGKPVKVTGTYPQGNVDIYEVTFSDGSKTKVCADHLWALRTAQQKFDGKGFEVIKRTEDLINDIRHSHNGYKKWFIPTLKNPVKYNKEKSNSIIDPYLIGLLLGDGTLQERYVSFSTADNELLERLSVGLPEKARLSKSGKYDYRISYGKQNGGDKIHQAFKDLKLIGKSHTKFIPKKYKYGSVEDRISIMQGLLDTDGSVAGSSATFSSASKNLTKDLQEIIWSLGGTATLHVKDKCTYMHNGEKRIGRKAYRLYIRLPEKIKPFRLTRKLDKLKNSQKRIPTRAIEKIEYIGKEEAKCISVDTEDSLYVTDDFILTHNTVSTIGAIHHLDLYPVLIVVPASLKGNWQEECEKWLPSHRSVGTINASDKKPEFRRRVLITNYAMLQKHKTRLKKIDFKCIVADESHYLKNGKAKRTKNFKSIAKNIEYRILLSGTPILNRPEEIMEQLKILNVFKSEFGGYWNFTKKFCAGEKTRWGYDTSGASNVSELHDKMLSTCYVRRNKKDVLTELPDKEQQVIKFDIVNSKEYEKVENDVVEYLKDKALNDEEFQEKISGYSEFLQKKMKERRAAKAINKALAAEHLVKLAELRKVAVKGKMTPITNWVDNFLESGEKLVLFAHHTKIADALEEKYDALKITGSVPSEDRQEIVNKFQNDPDEQLIVLNIAAGGVGLTLTAASHVAFVELPWTPGAVDQCADRCHRIGQKNAVNVYFLLGKDTIDEKVHELITEKRKVVEQVNAGKSLDDIEDIEEVERSSSVAKGVIADLLSK